MSNRAIVNIVLDDHISYGLLVNEMIVYYGDTLGCINLWTLVATLGAVAKHSLAVAGHDLLVAYALLFTCLIIISLVIDYLSIKT